MAEDQSFTPLVRKKLSDFVEESLTAYIERQLKAGNTKLPAEVELAQALSVSRTTIRRALSDLENRGLIFRIHGKGTFINPSLSQVKMNFSSGQPLLRLIEQCGFQPSSRLLYHLAGEASPFQQSALGLEDGAPVTTICKVFCADEIPVVLVVDDVPGELLAACPEEELGESTFDLLRRYAGVLCVRDEVRISAADSGSLLAYSGGSRVLDCEAALALDVVNYSDGNAPVFMSRQFFNTGCIKFHMTRLLDVY